MKNGIVKILAVGDVVGKNGSEYIRKNLWRIRKEEDIDILLNDIEDINLTKQNRFGDEDEIDL